MSAPFGPSPKLREYINWAVDKGNCTVREGLLGNKSMIRIEGPKGYAHIPGHVDDEPLSHSMISNLDRRLGVDAPFPKTPEPYR